MIIIVDYGLGNLNSIRNMFKKIGVASEISHEPDRIRMAQKLVLPGVGIFDEGMKNLADKGLLPILNDLALKEKRPTLGLCLGMQIMTRKSEEGKLPGLGWIDAETRRFSFQSENSGLKIPHMGWNTIKPLGLHPLFKDMPAEPRFYFVHSYHVTCSNSDNVLATTEYGLTFSSMIIRNNMVGAQFHPEKSHHFGMQLLKNFATWAPETDS